MGRKERRREDRALKLALATAALGVAKAMIDLARSIIDWLNK